MARASGSERAREPLPRRALGRPAAEGRDRESARDRTPGAAVGRAVRWSGRTCAQRLRRELRRVQREANLSTVLVTHDPLEAALLADEIIVLDDGRILQAGPSAAVFRHPGSAAIAALLGIANTRRAVVVGPGLLGCDGLEVRACTRELANGTDVLWRVRPERIALHPEGPYAALVLDDVDLGGVRELTVSLDAKLELTVRTDDTTVLSAGEYVSMSIAPEDVDVWPAAIDFSAG